MAIERAVLPTREISSKISYSEGQTLCQTEQPVLIRPVRVCWGDLVESSDLCSKVDIMSREAYDVPCSTERNC